MAQKRILELHPKSDDRDYGTFKAKARDFSTAIEIELRVDDLISQRIQNPDAASRSTRALLQLQATYEKTVVEAPEGFATELDSWMENAPSEAVDFYMAYAEALSAAEERFRKGSRKASD